jgi:hypothetical protein
VTEPLTTKQDALAAIEVLKTRTAWYADERYLDAIAAWLREACVVEGGHTGGRALEPGETCLSCGERREAGEGGR